MSGRNTWEVLLAENSLVEANEMKIIHSSNGPYRHARWLMEDLLEA